jgi:hypothetical protein
MTAPDFARIGGPFPSAEAVQAFDGETHRELKAAGATFFRYAWDRRRLLIEAWRTRPRPEPEPNFNIAEEHAT